MNSSNKAIDWQNLRLRLKAESDVLEDAFEPIPVELDIILRERAARLASIERAEIDPRSQTAMLECSTGGERYGIDIQAVLEVIATPKYTPVPGSSEILSGLISRRGQLFTIYDLSRLLTTAVESKRKQGDVILLRHESRHIGIRADTVDRVILIGQSSLISHGDASDLFGNFVSNVTRDGLSILNVAAIFHLTGKKRPN